MPTTHSSGGAGVLGSYGPGGGGDDEAAAARQGQREEEGGRRWEGADDRHQAAVSRSSGGAGVEGSYGPQPGPQEGKQPLMSPDESSASRGDDGCAPPLSGLRPAATAAREPQRSRRALTINLAAPKAWRPLLPHAPAGLIDRARAAGEAAADLAASVGGGVGGGGAGGVSESEVRAIAAALPPEGRPGGGANSQLERGGGGSVFDDEAAGDGGPAVRRLTAARGARAEEVASEAAEAAAPLDPVSMSDMEDAPGLGEAIGRVFGRDGREGRGGGVRSRL
jgi:hypothetical protein